MTRYAYVNGRIVPHGKAVVHIEDRGFQFADSVYEVIAVMNGRFADETGHLDRLARSLKELRIPLPMPRKKLQGVMRMFVKRNGLKNAALYIQVTRGVAPRDFKFPERTKPTLVMTISPAEFNPRAPKKAVTVPDIRWKRRDIKTTALIAQVLAKQAAADKGAHEAFMVDEKGFITEGASTNAWIVDKKGHLITRPTRNNAILKGVTRNALQALCKKEKIRFVERAFTPAEAYKAKESFTTAAVSLVTPIVEIDGKKIGNGKVGPVTSRIFKLYIKYAAGPKQEQWNAK